MTNLTLQQWTDTTAADLLQTLPLQSQHSATIYASSYLLGVGGWVPDNILNPTGTGVAANAQTPAQAAASIATAQFSSVYDLNFQVTVILEIQAMEKLIPGLNLNQASSSLLNKITTTITQQVNDSELPVRVDSVVSSGVVAGSSTLGGATDTTTRLRVYTETLAGSKVVDYKAIAVLYARQQYMLDLTWNVASVYVELGTPIAIIINKYTDINFTTLDGSNTRIYILTISPDTYLVTSGCYFDT